MPQFAFLPWLAVDEPVTFGSVTLVPAERAVEELEGHDRAYADRMRGAYIEWAQSREGGTVTVPMTFVRYRDLPLTAELSDGQFTEAATHLRVLGALAQRPEGQGDLQPANAFVLTGQHYSDGSFHLAVQAGRLLSGGWEMGKVQFTRPPFIPSRCRLRIWDGTLRDACASLLAAKPTDETRNVIAALEWFFYAHVENDEQNSLVHFVLLVTAFEALIGEDAAHKRSFAEFVAQALNTPDDTTLTRFIGGKDLTLTEQGWWAYDFYTVRSETVHGREIQPEQTRHGGTSHYVLGEMAFLLLLRGRMADLGFLNSMYAAAGVALFLEKLRRPVGADVH